MSEESPKNKVKYEKQEKKKFEPVIHSEFIQKKIDETNKNTESSKKNTEGSKKNTDDSKQVLEKSVAPKSSSPKNKILFNMVVVRKGSYDAGLGAWMIQSYQKNKSELLSLFPNSTDSFFEKGIEKGVLNEKRHIALIGLFPSKEVLIRLCSVVKTVSVFDFRPVDTILFDKGSEVQPKNLFYHFVPMNYPKNIPRPIASVLVWGYINNNKPLPEFVKYAQDAEGFKFEMPNSDAIHTYLQHNLWNFQPTREKWNSFMEKCTDLENDFESKIQEMIYEGEKLLHNRNILLNHTIENNTTRVVWKWNDKTYFIWLFQACQGVNCEVGNALMKTPFCKEQNMFPDFTMCWKYDFSNKEYIFHMFSIDEKENVYEISKTMGNTISSNRNCSMFHLSAEIKLHDLFEFYDSQKFQKLFSEEMLLRK